MNKNKIPGVLVKHLCLDRFNLTVADAAKLLKMTRANLYLLISGKTKITPDMAVRLEAVFNTDAKAWLDLQSQHDLMQARKKKLNLQRVSKKRVRV